MKMRPVQLVCLALLLATLRLADPAALAPDDFALRAGMLNVLLRGEPVELRAVAAAKPLTPSRIPAPAARAARLVAGLPAAQTFALRCRWTMPPPATHSVAVQSFTSFLRA